MNDDNLRYFGSNGAQGYEPGSFWNNLLKLVCRPPEDMSQRFRDLYQLFILADTKNSFHLQSCLPGVREVCVQVENQELTPSQAEERLREVLVFLPFLLMRFYPLNSITMTLANRIGDDLGDRLLAWQVWSIKPGTISRIGVMLFEGTKLECQAWIKENPGEYLLLDVMEAAERLDAAQMNTDFPF